MNYNEIIGTTIGKGLGYTAQSLLIYKIADIFNLNAPALFVCKTGSRYAVKAVKYAAKNYVRLDFSPEAIFNDLVDTAYSAY